MLRRGGPRKFAWANCKIPWPRLFSALYVRGGGVHRKKMWIRTITAKFFSYPHTEFGGLRSRRLAVILPQIRKCLFWVTLACLDISSKKRCLLRLFIYHFKAHTISNKLVSKISAQKKGKKSYDSSNKCYNFFGFGSSPPIKTVHLEGFLFVFLSVPWGRGVISNWNFVYSYWCWPKVDGVQILIPRN